MSFGERWNLISGFPKSVFYNIRWFGLKNGLRMPILFGGKCFVHVDKKACVSINCKPQFGLIKIAINEGPFIKGRGEKSVFKLVADSKVIFEGKCNINAGSVINVNGGECLFGNRFAANAHFLLSCEKRITFRDDILFGWDCSVIDGDGHDVLDEKTHEIVNKPKEVIIGNHTWIAAKASILKGAKIPQDSVVGYGSIVTKGFIEDNVILAGIPSEVVKKGITWER